MKFIHTYDTIRSLSINNFIALIKTSVKIAIKDLKLVDLIFDKRSLIGVYVISDSTGKPVYVARQEAGLF